MISPDHCPACNEPFKDNYCQCPKGCVWSVEQFNSLCIARGQRPGWVEPDPKSPAATAPRLVLVEWLDSHYRPGWTTDETLPEPVTCRSAGWIVGENPQGLVLASNVSIEATPQRCGDITIPKRSIVSITNLAISAAANPDLWKVIGDALNTEPALK